MAFLKTILIILLIYYGVKILSKLLAPYLMRYIAKKASDKFGEAFGSGPTSTNTKEKEGKVSIDKMPPSKSNKGKTVGEYVDFEEVE